MPPLELDERLALLGCAGPILGLAFEEIYKRDEPAIQAASGHFRSSGSPERCFTWSSRNGAWHLPRAFLPLQRGYMPSFAARNRRRPAGR
jgi:hypothetical protein